MPTFISFVLETMQGVLFGVGVPVLIYLIITLSKEEKRDEARAMFEGRQKTYGTASCGKESSQASEDVRKNARKQDQWQGGESGWLDREMRTLYELRVIANKGICGAVYQLKGRLPPYLTIVLLEYLVALPLAGHIACSVIGIAEDRTGIDFSLIGTSFIKPHLQLILVYSVLELVLHSVWLYIREQERAIFAMLGCIRKFLCANLGKKQGMEASRFIGLVMDTYLGPDDDRFIKSIAMKRSKEGKMDAKESLSIIISLVLSRCIELKLIPLSKVFTPKGQEVFNSIRALVREKQD